MAYKKRLIFEILCEQDFRKLNWYYEVDLEQMDVDELEFILKDLEGN